MDHERQLLEQQLWELLYDLLPEAEAQSLRGRIASEPEVGALYDRVIRQQRIVADAVKWPCEEIPLAAPEAPAATIVANGIPAPASAFGAAGIRRRRWGRSYLARAISVLAAIGAAVLLGWIGYCRLGPDSILAPQALADAVQQVIQEQRRVVICGPSRLVEGAPQSFTVAVTTAVGEPVRSDLHYAFYARQSGTAVAEGRAVTEADGRTKLEPPAEWNSSRGWLEVRPDKGEPLAAWFDIEPAQDAARAPLNANGSLGAQQEFLARGKSLASVLSKKEDRQAERFVPSPPPTAPALASAAPAPPSDKAPTQTRSYFRDTNAEPLEIAGGAAGSAGAEAAAAEEAPQLAKQIAPVAELGDAIDSVARSSSVAAKDERVSFSLVERDVEEGSPLKIEVVSQGPALPLVLGALCRGALVAQREVVLPPQASPAPVRQQIELSLPEGATGPVQVALFNYSQSPPALVASEIAHCRMRRLLRIQAAAVASGIADETELVEVTVSDENGAPVQALLSVAGESQPTKEPEIELRLAEPARRGGEQDLADGVAQLDAVNDGENAKRAVAGSGNAPPVKLQSAPTRAFAADADASPAEGLKYGKAPLGGGDSFGFSLGRISAEGGNFQPPLVADNAAEIQTAVELQFAQLRRERDQASARLARISVVSGALLLGLLLATAYLKNEAPTWLWTAAFAGAVVAIGVGITGPGAPQQLPQLALVTFPQASETRGDARLLAGVAAPAQDALAGADSPQSPASPALQRFGAISELSVSGGESKNDQLDVWLPRLATGADGKATIAIPRPTQPTTLRLSLEGHGSGRTGQAEVEVQLLPRE